MQRCIELAEKGLGNTYPNPLVGCVIVKNDEIIAEGWHKKAGAAHAEVDAIQKVIDKSILEECTLFVNLEPCNHFGKTPPCVNLIIDMRIPNVVIGCQDSNEKVSGKGIKKLIEAGCNVITGVLENKCQTMNQRFFTFHEKKRPYIILKWAESKDGYIAPKNQIEPFWMTSSESKKLVHKWRAEETAILVGRVTAEKDNPCLTVREVEGENPIRIVIDKNLKLSTDLNLFNNNSKTIVFNAIKSGKNDTNNFIKIDFNILINNILSELYKLNIQSIIIEGGSKTLQSFIDENMWDEARIFTANKTLVEGVKAPTIEGGIISEEDIGGDQLKLMSNV